MRKNILGSIIKEIRKNKKMTQKQLSQLTGFSQNTISNHENGNRSLDEDDIHKYANALNTSIENLFAKAEVKQNKFNKTYEINTYFPLIVNKKMNELNITIKDLAAQLEIPETKVRKWLFEENYRNVPMNKLLKIAKILNISPRYLDEKLNFSESYEDYINSKELESNLIGILYDIPFKKRLDVYNYAETQLNEQKQEQQSNVIPFNNSNDDKLISFDWYGYASAGTGEFLDGNENKTTIQLPKKDIPSNADFALTVNGDSMKPVFKNHEMIFVERTTDLPSGSIGIVIIDGEAFIKKIYINDDCMTLVSLNPGYEDKVIKDAQSIKVIGRVII